MTSAEARFPPSAEWSAVAPSHEWARTTEEQDMDYVYHGRMGALPKSSAKIVRIFLSSTFTDTVVERNMLMKHVFPQMRQYCRDKYDLDFQVVDMRWGVRQEASVDHSASELCVREIKNCNEVSLGPTFVTLVSHRYGGRPLRVRIPEAEMDILLAVIRKTNPYDALFVLEWYQRDTNAIPPEYILKPMVTFEDAERCMKEQSPKEIKRWTLDSEVDAIHKEHRKQMNEEYQRLLEAGIQRFHDAQPRLKEIFKKVAKQCLSEGLLSEEQAERYLISVTEEEIIEGVRKNERRRDRCLAFVRELTDIDFKHDLAWRFVDMEDGKVDKEAQQLLAKLRDETLPKLLPAENIFRFKAKWSETDGVNEQDQKEYLAQFCDTFKRALIEQIDRGVKASKFTNDALFSEILEHAHQCVGKVERFYGREDILGVIKEYLWSGCDKPLMIWGESGCGKTSVLAKAAKMTPDWLGDNKDLLIPVRFLGTTPESSTVYRTLASLSRQLIHLCGLQGKFPEIPQEFSDLKDLFKDILAAIPKEKRVVMYVDSLDQLSEANGAHKLAWLPLSLPSNVKLVLSVLPTEHAILSTLRDLMGQEEQYVEVANLKTETSHMIIKKWLEMQHRKLSEEQEAQIEKLIVKDVRPLYLKLVYDEIHTWKSFETSDFECSTIKDCLTRLYRRIETKHGEILVSKALGYLSASSSGLTELEIEDILSLDEDVLTDVYQFHIPPIRRLPSILWARVRRDLDEYIVDREADGTKVMAWYHRQFIETANERYLGVSGAFARRKERAHNKDFYLTLRDYFAGIWAGDNPKPFKYTQWQMKKLKVTSEDGKEIRHVSAQPNIFRATDGSIDIENPRYNLRKLSELPPVCKKLDGLEDGIIAFIAKHIVVNPEFLCAWIKNKPWEEVSEFVTNFAREGDTADESKEYTKICKKQFDGQELTDEEMELLNKAESMLEGDAGLSLQMATIHSCLLLSYISVLRNPTFFGVDVCGRLLPYHGIMGAIDDWVRYCDNEGRQLCALVPPHLQLETPGSELLFVINNHDGPVLAAQWAEEDENLCFSFSSKFIAVSLELGQVVIDTRPRSVPKGDSFNKAVVVDLNDMQYSSTKDEQSKIEPKHGHDDFIVASLRDKPWLYIFDKDGDLIEYIKCDEILKDELRANGMEPEMLRISEMTLYQTDGIVLILYDTQMSHLIFLQSDFTVRFVPRPWGNVLAICRHEAIAMIFDDAGRMRALKSKGEETEWQQLKSPISAHHDMKNHDDGNIVICGLMNGKIVLIEGKEFKVTKQFDATLPSGEARYGVANFVYGKQYKNYSRKIYDFLIVACSKSHLLLLSPKEASTESSSEDDDDENEGESKTNKPEVKEMKLVLRVKKQYHMVEITSSFSLLIAAHGGQLDLFQLKIPEKNDGPGIMKASGHFFTSIDAHSQQISRILTTAEDILFMTASLDSTLKFWMVARAGVTKKYIPNFDRAEKPLTNVIPDDEHALAAGIDVRSIHDWNVVKGRMALQFSHPSRRGRFTSFMPDAKRTTLYALDTQQRLHFWNLKQHRVESAMPPGKRLKRRMTKTGEQKEMEEAVKAKQVPVQKVVNLREYMPRGYVQRTVIECAVNKGLILRNNVGRFFHFTLDDNEDNHKVTQIDLQKNSGRKSMKLDDHRIVVVAMDSDAKKWMFYVYHIANGIESVSQFSGSHVNEHDMVLCHTGEILIPVSNEVVLLNPMNGDQRKVPIPNLGGKAKVITSKSGTCVAYCVTNLKYRGLDITENSLTVSDWIRSLSPDAGDSLQEITFTHDGKYILCVTNDRMLRLIRYSDGKLLALYTMYDLVCALHVSSNNHYALISTFDKRLFTLVIADPRERDHDQRIAHVRNKNPGLSREQALALMGEANLFEDEGSDDSNFDSSDDEAMMRRAEKRLDKTQKVVENVLFCLQSDDESSEESEGDSRAPTRMQGLKRRETTIVEVYENGLQPTAHDGTIFTPSPCSLQ